MSGSIWTRKKDKKAMAVIESLVKYAKPDLVAVTGYVSFPMLNISGTINNMRPAKMSETMLKPGSTKVVFVGHDHYNTHSITYKGIQLTYGMSIDYLAYKGISKRINQRGASKMGKIFLGITIVIKFKIS